MIPTLELPDAMARGGMLAGNTPVVVGEALVIQGGRLHGRRCTYIGPHADRRTGAWTGKLNVQLVDSMREATVGPRQLKRPPAPPAEVDDDSQEVMFAA